MGVKGVSVNLLNTLVDMTEGRLLREGGGVTTNIALVQAE